MAEASGKKGEEINAECRHERSGSALMEDVASEMGDEDSSDAMANVSEEQCGMC